MINVAAAAAAAAAAVSTRSFFCSTTLDHASARLPRMLLKEHQNESFDFLVLTLCAGRLQDVAVDAGGRPRVDLSNVTAVRTTDSWSESCQSAFHHPRFPKLETPAACSRLGNAADHICVGGFDELRSQPSTPTTGQRSRCAPTLRIRTAATVAVAAEPFCVSVCYAAGSCVCRAAVHIACF